VLTAVDLDNQARLVANKIGDVAPEGYLAAESVPLDLTRPQYSPEAPFGVCHLVS
jgi:hypothetical protein